jgi:hypothetical protein
LVFVVVTVAFFLVSVFVVVDMKSIDVEARLGGREDGWTCLITAAEYGQVGDDNDDDI